MWNMLMHYEIPKKISNMDMIELLFENFTCQVMLGWTVTGSSLVTTIVRQGCILYNLLFIILLEVVKQNTLD